MINPFGLLDALVAWVELVAEKLPRRKPTAEELRQFEKHERRWWWAGTVLTVFAILFAVPIIVLIFYANFR